MPAETNAARAAEIEALAAEMKAEMDRREAMYPLAGSIVNSDAVNDKLTMFRAIVSALVKVQREAEARGRLDMWQQADQIAMAHTHRTFRDRLQDIRPDTPSSAAQPVKGEI